jgi:hypothetical protein
MTHIKWNFLGIEQSVGNVMMLEGLMHVLENGEGWKGKRKTITTRWGV